VKRVLDAEAPAADILDGILADEYHHGYVLDTVMRDAELAFRSESDDVSESSPD
jgi:hypothetical protein